MNGGQRQIEGVTGQLTPQGWKYWSELSAAAPAPAPEPPTLAFTPRTPQPLSQPPARGWASNGSAPAGGFDSILNGTAPQFAAPQATQAPQPLPRPAAPQQNFDQLGAALMAQILQQSPRQGG